MSSTKFEKEKGEKLSEEEKTTVLVVRYVKKKLIQVELCHNCVNWTELDDKTCCYQLIISTTKFQKEKGEKFFGERKDNSFNREIGTTRTYLNVTRPIEPML